VADFGLVGSWLGVGEQPLASISAWRPSSWPDRFAARSVGTSLVRDRLPITPSVQAKDVSPPACPAAAAGWRKPARPMRRSCCGLARRRGCWGCRGRHEAFGAWGQFFL